VQHIGKVEEERQVPEHSPAVLEHFQQLLTNGLLAPFVSAICIVAGMVKGRSNCALQLVTCALSVGAEGRARASAATVLSHLRMTHDS